ncbi:hypothetical protein FS842_004782 [Serendipita sp. 407]|nr:hypothetical protein FRC15_006954 [Serendipita sp. 397]KAG9028298.1 hypothetical protein FS842_004782 [Serendipita sp. 407]
MSVYAAHGRIVGLVLVIAKQTPPASDESLERLDRFAWCRVRGPPDALEDGAKDSSERLCVFPVEMEEAQGDEPVAGSVEGWPLRECGL